MIKVTFMFGAAADRFEETGKVPTSKYVNEHGGEVITRTYQTKAEYTACAKILRDTCQDNFASKILTETPENAKQLYVFIWDCSHMPSDATEEEVIEAWEQGPTRSHLEDYEDEDTLYEVERMTLNEYKREHNTSDCAYGQCYIGFFYMNL